MRFETANQAGRAYQIVLELNHPGFNDWKYTILQSWTHRIGAHPFQIDPPKMLASFGSDSAFTTWRFPTIVKVDGQDANNTLDKDGLPAPIKVHLADDNGHPLRHPECSKSEFGCNQRPLSRHNMCSLQHSSLPIQLRSNHDQTKF